MQRSSRVVFFATSNPHKLREVQGVLSEYGVDVEQLPSKGVEIQADDLSSVAAHASRESSRSYDRAILVEDAGLFIDELNGFPGPYSSYVYKRVGLEKLLLLLEALRSRSASFKSSIAYCLPDKEPTVFEGEVRGEITLRPSGTYGFGFDPIFRPEGYAITLAEMSTDEKSRVSHRGRSVRKFASWFLKNHE